MVAFADPNAELLKQLTRIADAMSKSGTPAWFDWVKTLGSFVLGLITAYITLLLQGRSSDKREQDRMRRIIYSELAQSFVLLDSMIRGSDLVPNKGKRYQLIQDICAFHGEAYMKENHAIFYGLEEGTDISWMYSWFHKIPSGGIYGSVEMKAPLGFLCERFQQNPVIKKNFKRFASAADFNAIEEGVKLYKRSATIEEMIDSGIFVVVPKQTS
jgi:hypothetical protein